MNPPKFIHFKKSFIFISVCMCLLCAILKMAASAFPVVRGQRKKKDKAQQALPATCLLGDTPFLHRFPKPFWLPTCPLALATLFDAPAAIVVVVVVGTCHRSFCLPVCVCLPLPMGVRVCICVLVSSDNP